MRFFGWGKDKGQQIKKATGLTVIAPEHKIDLSLIPLEDLLCEIEERSASLVCGYFLPEEKDMRIISKTETASHELWIATALRIKAESSMYDE